jgi:hypothetical protein
MKKYLSALKNDDSPVGDLAFDLLRDKNYPYEKFTRSKIKSHVLSQTSDPFVLQAMRDLFRMYRTSSRVSFARERQPK